MNHYELDERLARALLSYLAGRPYGEVHQLIAALQRMPLVGGQASAGDAPDLARQAGRVQGHTEDQR